MPQSEIAYRPLRSGAQDAGLISGHGAASGTARQSRVSLPGGCVLGPRPVDQHVLGFKRLGAKITDSKGYITATAKT